MASANSRERSVLSMSLAITMRPALREAELSFRPLSAGERLASGGEVRLEWEEGDEDCPPGYMLHHLNGNGQGGGLAVNTFEALCGNWWNLLKALDLAKDQQRTPEWQQNKLRRIFGDLDDLALPAGCVPVK